MCRWLGLNVQRFIIVKVLCISGDGDVQSIYGVQTGEVPPMGDAEPILVEPGGDDILRKLILRALNNNQRLILRNLNDQGTSLNAFLEKLSRKENRPLSTLKLNARILKDLGLIEYGTKEESKPVRLTPHGKLVLHLMEKRKNVSEEKKLVEILLRHKREKDILLLDHRVHLSDVDLMEIPGVLKLSFASIEEKIRLARKLALATKLDGSEGRIFLLLSSVDGNLLSIPTVKSMDNLFIIVERGKIGEKLLEKLSAEGCRIICVGDEELSRALETPDDGNHGIKLIVVEAMS